MWVCPPWLKLKCIRPPVAYNSMGQTGRSFKFKALETLRLIYVAEDVYLVPFLSWLAVELRALEVEELSYGVSDVGSTPLSSSWSLRQSHLAVLHALASRVVNLTYDPSGILNFPIACFGRLRAFTISMTWTCWAESCIEDEEVAELDVVLGARAFWDLEELDIDMCVVEAQMQPGMQEEITAHIRSRLPRLVTQSGVKLQISYHPTS
ncbi:hypothetical protein C8Q76DRAFT_794905 [Earliella scabrosa]|nr:hypothetical protein C8Q76DRAFT_794905 [Earliella scabrosa]